MVHIPCLPIRRCSRNSGFSLIEVMVAIVIFSVGMLGMLNLILNSLVITGSSNYRSIASQLTYAIADSVRGNGSQIAAYNEPASWVVTDTCLTDSGCTSAEFIETEYGMWRARLAGALPNGAGVVCRDQTPTDGDSLNWNCDDSGSAPFVVKICWNDNQVFGGQICTRTVI